MNKYFMKKFFVMLTSVLVVMIGLVGCASPVSPEPVPEPVPEPEITMPASIKNVIVMIGDGFGPNHLANAKKFFGIDQFAFEKDYVCEVTTHSNNSEITDSAAAATALATGHKVNNEEVGRHQSKDLQNIMEVAQAAGKKTGVLTTDTLNGATPAGFSAHVTKRDNSSGIIEDQAVSGVDIFVGTHNVEYDNYESSQKIFSQNGYQMLNGQKEDDTACLDTKQKYLITFPSLQATYNHSLAYPKQIWVDFTQVIKNVLTYLDNENGFCLMIENAWIDKFSHNNNFIAAMHEVVYYARMIEAVYEFCQARTDTAVFITADHETGDLAFANTTEQLNSSLFKSTGHTKTNVNLYIKFAVAPEERKFKTVIDNTDIFKLCKKIVTDGEFGWNLIQNLAEVF